VSPTRGREAGAGIAVGQVWQGIRLYLFDTPGSSFSYYTAFIVAIAFIAAFCGYHYLLEARRRFRNYVPVLRVLDGLAAWTAGLAGAAALLLVARKSDYPFISWRLWLYVYVLAAVVVFIRFLVRLYRGLPRDLAAHDNDLLKRRYLAPANQRQVAGAPSRRRTHAGG